MPEVVSDREDICVEFVGDESWPNRLAIVGGGLIQSLPSPRDGATPQFLGRIELVDVLRFDDGCDDSVLTGGD